ncbi:Phage tail tube protein [Paenibacillus catalpae]|uniref:Phage tail tube protein n=1 Tax=Paenibacillus catalpae TaxID=1045775 RepID=A0A1I2BF76_9BACL|nr:MULTISPECIES: phage tail tube protein [Paenibacillus]MCM3626877.1 phage tail tube protein [Paenibacillus glycanilyticus]SFE54538.1 Phage tail tube protein [Paenibacillus catalpae]
MAKFRADNTINGREARLFIDSEEIGYAKSFEATIEKNKVDVAVLGNRWLGKKTTSLSGTGTLTLYKVTTKFSKMLLEYATTGKDVYFTLQGVLDDPGAGRGTERITLLNCNIDSVKIGQFNVEAEVLEEEIPFTFEGAEIPEALKDGFE